jgi:hypothetical protein
MCTHCSSFLNEAPKTKRVPTLDETVGDRFRGLLAKGDKCHNLANPVLESVGGPNEILSEEPREEFCFERSPNLPNRLMQKGGGGANKLHLVG